MKLTLTEEQLAVLINELKRCHTVTFNTTYESKLTGFILKEFLQGLMVKYIKQKSIHKICIDEKTLLVLDYVLPQIKQNLNDVYSDAIIYEIYQEINKACLSI